jgi:hypothetical protein
MLVDVMIKRAQVAAETTGLQLKTTCNLVERTHIVNTVEERTFNPSSHIIQISTNHGPKDYLPVQWRLVWLRSLCPDAQIETELLHLDMDKEVTHVTREWNDEKRKYEKVTLHGQGVAVFKATVKTPTGATATGTKQENAAAFADYIEKAETGAIGRALAALGYGTQFTGDELDEGTDRIADAPVQRKSSYDPDAPATAQQLDTIDRLRANLGMQSLASEDALTFGECAAMLKELSAQIQQKRKAS